MVSGDWKEVGMIERYVTVNDMAERWFLDPRTVEIMYAEGKIEGVTRFGNVWAIPTDAKKPTDNRGISEKYKNWRKNIQKRFRMTECVLLE